MTAAASPGGRDHATVLAGNDEMTLRGTVDTEKQKKWVEFSYSAGYPVLGNQPTVWLCRFHKMLSLFSFNAGKGSLIMMRLSVFFTVAAPIVALSAWVEKDQEVNLGSSVPAAHVIYADEDEFLSLRANERSSGSGWVFMPMNNESRLSMKLNRVETRMRPVMDLTDEKHAMVAAIYRFSYVSEHQQARETKRYSF